MKGSTLKAISEMNHMRLQGKIVSLGEAKFRRLPHGKKRLMHVEPRVQHEEEPKKSVSGKEVVIAQEVEVTKNDMQVADQHGSGWRKRVEVSIAEENMDWLVRSLVESTLKPIGLQSLKMAICKNIPQVVEVREIGACKVLVTFDTTKHAAETFTFKLDRMLQFFHKVRRWEESEWCETRRVWLECYGVPLHVWSSETFKIIGRLWGDVVMCEVDTKARSSLITGWVQVDTCVFDVIRDWIHISVGISGFDIFVKEVGFDVCDIESTMRG
ncbi:uncharacterized protein LOC110268122 [Arachis ipaensis]|uniref:uncharacterized protein LOC110268122 n=1 Tax=Arachis ipaensis TaxID=130454 RepID=UPI000A2B280C|nr:uncharacterized protein LOC110268122 [Arachis ipaensis]